MRSRRCLAPRKYCRVARLERFIKLCIGSLTGLRFIRRRRRFARPPPPSRKRSRSARLFACKRAHNGALSMPTFCGNNGFSVFLCEKTHKMIGRRAASSQCFLGIRGSASAIFSFTFIADKAQRILSVRGERFPVTPGRSVSSFSRSAGPEGRYRRLRSAGRRRREADGRRRRPCSG